MTEVAPSSAPPSPPTTIPPSSPIPLVEDIPGFSMCDEVYQDSLDAVATEEEIAGEPNQSPEVDSQAMEWLAQNGDDFLKACSISTLDRFVGLLPDGMGHDMSKAEASMPGSFRMPDPGLVSDMDKPILANMLEQKVSPEEAHAPRAAYNYATTPITVLASRSSGEDVAPCPTFAIAPAEVPVGGPDHGDMAPAEVHSAPAGDRETWNEARSRRTITPRGGQVPGARRYLVNHPGEKSTDFALRKAGELPEGRPLVTDLDQVDTEVKDGILIWDSDHVASIFVYNTGSVMVGGKPRAQPSMIEAVSAWTLENTNPSKPPKRRKKH